jgi:parvulin-like peptidyl-prolyl isomerase
LLEIAPVLTSARWMTPLALIALTLNVGCQSNDPAAADGGAQLAPADFDAVTEREPASADASGDEDASSSAAADAAQADAAQASADDPAGRSGEAENAGMNGSAGDDAAPQASAANGDSANGAGSTNEENASRDRAVVDAMVGQVNGEPIYAGEVFKSIGEEQLKRLGESQPRLAFRQRARELIVSELRSRVTNSLLLKEAERDLSERERRGLKARMREERKKILRQHGGVRALAEKRLQEKTGRTIEEEIEARRKSMLIERYMHKKFRPRVHVGRRDVERYYQDHYNEYNPTPEVTVRLILARDAETADRVQEALSSGEPFKEVARQYSDVRAEQGGLMPSFQIDGSFEEFDSLRWPALNKAVRNLEEGEHSDRIELDAGAAWVKLEELESGEGQSLQEVFLQIQQKLRSQKLNRLQQRHIQELMEDGNFTPIDQMVQDLLKVAMARYAQPR